jgi:hypothetical protein
MVYFDLCNAYRLGNLVVLPRPKIAVDIMGVL